MNLFFYLQTFILNYSFIAILSDHIFVLCLIKNTTLCKTETCENGEKNTGTIAFRFRQVLLYNGVTLGPYQYKLWPNILTRSVIQLYLTLTIPSLSPLGKQPSWGRRRTLWFFFCNFSTVWCGRLLKLYFLGFWNYNSVIHALSASNTIFYVYLFQMKLANKIHIFFFIKLCKIFTYDFVQYVHVQLII
jgi:hypothetical protein